jgi:hypothetical protein
MRHFLKRHFQNFRRTDLALVLLLPSPRQAFTDRNRSVAGAREARRSWSAGWLW